MRILMVMVLLTAVSLAGCAGGGDADGEDTETQTPSPTETGTDTDTGTATESQTTTTTSSSPTPKRDPVTWEITIQGNDFVDGSITIQVGDTVRWVHRDGPTPHTVTAKDGGFDSDNGATNRMTEAVNSEFEHTFDSVGEFPYVCEVHSSMTDAITVLERSDATPPT